MVKTNACKNPSNKPKKTNIARLKPDNKPMNSSSRDPLMALR